MQSAGTLPPKKDVARALLLRGSVFVHLDPREEGVTVPPWLRNQAQLVLQVGLDMPLPIPDLRVDEAGVFGTLSFSRSPFTCMVPWDAVFALVGEDGQGLVWPESMPDEIAEEVERESGEKGPPAPTDEGPEPPRTAGERVTPEVRDARAGSEPPPAGAAEGDDGKVVRLDDRRPSTALARVEQALPEPADADETSASEPGETKDDASSSPEAPPRSRDDQLDDSDEESPAAQDRDAGEPGRKRRKRRELPPYLKVVK